MGGRGLEPLDEGLVGEAIARVVVPEAVIARGGVDIVLAVVVFVPGAQFFPRKRHDSVAVRSTLP